jgi:hypothetical protein
VRVDGDGERVPAGDGERVTTVTGTDVDDGPPVATGESSELADVQLDEALAREDAHDPGF